MSIDIDTSFDPSNVVKPSTSYHFTNAVDRQWVQDIASMLINQAVDVFLMNFSEYFMVQDKYLHVARLSASVSISLFDTNLKLQKRGVESEPSKKLQFFKPLIILFVDSDSFINKKEHRYNQVIAYVNQDFVPNDMGGLNREQLKKISPYISGYWHLKLDSFESMVYMFDTLYQTFVQSQKETTEEELTPESINETENQSDKTDHTH